jgi:hypothetical protein
MSESWRHILQQAGPNRSADEADGPETSPAKYPMKERVSLQSALENSAALARQLEVMSARATQLPMRSSPARSEHFLPTVENRLASTRAPVPSPNLAVAPPSAQTFAAQKAGAWRNIAALSFSGAILGLTGYAFLSQDQSSPKFSPRALTHTQESAFAVNPVERIEAPVSSQSIKTFGRATEDVLLERAYIALTSADVAGARVMFGVLAEHGSRDGALGLAETYDPHHFSSRMGSAEPNERMAREWYQRAVELGSQRAAKRLDALNRG